MAIQQPDFVDSLEIGLESIDANTGRSSSLLKDIKDVLNAFSSQILKENDRSNKNITDSLNGLRTQQETRAKSEDKRYTEENIEKRAQEIKANRAAENEKAYRTHIMNQFSELTATEKAKKVATDIWQSQILAHMRSIVDEQQKAYRRMAEERGLGKEGVQQLMADVKEVRQKINVSGGYLFSDEQVRQALDKLSKAGFTTDKQKEYAGIVAEMEVGFGNVSESFLKGINAFDQLAKGMSSAQKQETIKGIAGGIDQAFKAMKIDGKDIRSRALGSAINEESIEKMLTAGRGQIDTQQALRILQRGAIVEQGLGPALSEGYRKIQSNLLNALADPGVEANAKYIEQLRVLTKDRPDLASLSQDEFIKKMQTDSSALSDMALAIYKSVGSGGEAGATFSKLAGFDESMIRKAQLYGDKFKEVEEKLVDVDKILNQPIQNQAKSFNDLTKTIGTSQGIFEKLNITVTNILANTGLAGMMTGIGTFAEFSRAFSGGKGLFTYLKDLFQSSGKTVAGTAAKAGASTGAGALSTLGRVAKIGGGIASVATGAVLGGMALSDYASAQSPEQKRKAELNVVGTGGMLAGGAAGAALGSVVLPVIGTLIGGVVGAWLGEEGMKQIADPILDEIRPILDEVAPHFEEFGNKIKGAWNSIKEWWEEADIANMIGEAVASFITGAKITWNLLNLALVEAKRTFSEMKETFLSIPEGLTVAFNTVAAGITGAVSSVINGIVALVSKFDKFGLLSDEINKLKQMADYAGDSSRKFAEETAKIQAAHNETMSKLNAKYDAETEQINANIVKIYDEAEARKKAREEKKLKEQEERYAKSSVRTPDGSHLTGLDKVPHDGYVGLLHKDEMVLPAKEAEQYRQLKLNWGNVDKSKIDSNFLMAFSEILESDAMKQWGFANGIEEILIISGLRDVNKQSALHKGGYGAFKSAHLIGKALDFNLKKDGKYLNAFLGPRKNDIVHPENEAYYKEFGQIVMDSNSLFRSGAFFKHKDPNHIELSLTQQDRDNLNALRNNYIATNSGTTTNQVPSVNIANAGDLVRAIKQEEDMQRNETMIQQYVARSRQTESVMSYAG